MGVVAGDGGSGGILVDSHLLLRSAGEAEKLAGRFARHGTDAEHSTELAAVHLHRDGFALGAAMSRLSDSWQDTMSELDRSWLAVIELLRWSAYDMQRTDQEVQGLLERLLDFR